MAPSKLSALTCIDIRAGFIPPLFSLLPAGHSGVIPHSLIIPGLALKGSWLRYPNTLFKSRVGLLLLTVRIIDGSSQGWHCWDLVGMILLDHMPEVEYLDNCWECSKDHISIVFSSWETLDCRVESPKISCVGVRANLCV